MVKPDEVKRPGKDALRYVRGVALNHVQAPFPGPAGTHHYQGCRAIGDLGGVAGCDGGAGGKGGGELGQGLQGGIGAGALIVAHGDGLAALLHSDGHDLRPEGPVFGGRHGLAVAADGELVLLPPGDLIFGGDGLGGMAHVVVVEGAPQAVVDHGVHQLAGPHADAAAAILEEMGGEAHVLHASGCDSLGLAELDEVGSQHHRRHTRGTCLVYGEGRGGGGYARLDARLARRHLAQPGGDDVTHDHIVHLFRLDARPFHRLLDGDSAQLRGRDGGKGPHELPLRGPRAAYQDNFFHIS